MSEDRTIPTPAPADKPTFTLFSDGEEVTKEFQVLTIVISKEVNKVASAILLFHDGDPSQETFKISDSDFFIPGKEIKIQAGYHSEETELFKGIVVSHGIKSMQNKSSMLRVVCKDKAVKLTVGRKNRYFYDTTDSDVIEELAGESGLDTDVEPTQVTHRELVLFNTTPWDFMVSRADVNGKLVITDNGTLVVKKPDLGQDPVLALAYGGNIMGFEAEMDARHQYSSLKSFSWNAANQEMAEMEADSFGNTLPGNISPDDLAAVIGLNADELHHAGQLLEEEMQEWVNARQMKSKISKVRGRVRFQGFGDINPSDIVELSGMGDRFNGNAYVSGVRHEINDSNWETDVSIGLSPEWYTRETPDIIDTKAGGLLPAINGLQIGLVSKLEEDPDGEYRVQVRIPMINPAEEGVWARVATLDAGDTRGSFFRPEIGDEVVLGFLNDDPRNAVILGMMHSSAKPAPLEPADDNHEKGYFTRSGMKILFNDEKQTILTETVNGNKLLFSDDEGSILVEDENGNKVLLDSSGITLESAGDILLKASGDVTIEGTNVSSKANANFKAEGSAGAELSTSASAVIKGSMVQIN